MNTENLFGNMGSPIKDLIEITFAVNEEISSENVSALNKEIEYLCEKLKSDKILFTLVKMTRALGKYIEKNESNCHPETLTLLNSLTNELDNIATNQKLTLAEKSRIIQDELNKFNELKQEISPLSRDYEMVLKLKTILLSLEWEIKDDTLSSLDETIESLKIEWKNKKVRSTFLSIISNLGKYIALHKVKAHTKTIPFLHSIYNNLEIIVRNPDLSKEETKKILKKNLDQYNLFRVKAAQIEAKSKENKKLSEPIPALKEFKKPDSYLDYPEDDFSPLDHDTEQTLEIEEYDPKTRFKKPVETAPQDIMNDLFNPKESDVDDLLDKIHQQNLTGLNQTTGMPGIDFQNESIPAGMKKVIPEKNKNTTPISEIDDKLEEFFDLDSPVGDEEEDFFDDLEDNEEEYAEEIYISTEEEDEKLFENTETKSSFKPLTNVEIQAVEQLKLYVDQACDKPNEISLRNIKAKIGKLEIIYKNDPKILPLIKILYSLNQLNLEIFQKEKKPGFDRPKPFKDIFKKAKNIFPSSK